MPEEGYNKVEFEAKPQANTGCLRGILYFLLIASVSLFLAIFGWNCINDVLSLTKQEKEAVITIPEEFTIRELSRELADLGIINHAWLFKLYCDFSHAEEKIEPGEYLISSTLDYNAIVKSFVTVTIREEVWVVIPEGKTLLETLTILADAGVCDLERLLETADEEEFGYWFLEDVPMAPGRLEGYLFPDSYSFYTDWNPRSALLKLLDKFNAQIPNSKKTRLSNIDYSLNEILTIASLIQMEAANDAEMKNISTVIWNRLKNNMPLQVDATSVYLMGKDNIQSQEDVLIGRTIDSPYNTFLHTGLPPGPICSAGNQAINDAMYPGSEKYLYYALHVDRTHRFFNTEKEFLDFINSKDAAPF